MITEEHTVEASQDLQKENCLLDAYKISVFKFQMIKTLWQSIWNQVVKKILELKCIAYV